MFLSFCLSGLLGSILRSNLTGHNKKFTSGRTNLQSIPTPINGPVMKDEKNLILPKYFSITPNTFPKQYQ